MMKRIFAILGLFAIAAGPLVYATQTNLVGPAGSGRFGTTVTVLTNGNFVVTDPYYSIPGGATNVGAVYLYDGVTLDLIGALTGNTNNDYVGIGGVTLLGNGNYVVRSYYWDNGTAANAGALTWCSGIGGVAGAVSAANSLVGSKANDRVGNGSVTLLSNGNYVVHSPDWGNGAATNAGAVTWCNGTVGLTGVVSAANSLVGSKANDRVGVAATVLANGNYVVRSYEWDNGAAANAGAVTWCSGAGGSTGVVSPANSLVGSANNDLVGNGSVTALANGNYVVRSLDWDNGAIADAGAVTWGSGTGGVTGVVSAANSLVGSTAYDWIGDTGLIALSNGNYVVCSYRWDNGAATNAGAATWGSGTGGLTGVVSAANSLVGSTNNDEVGDNATALANGNYVVHSPNWDNGAVANVGAATWCNGAVGLTGTLSAANSLVGGTTNDRVGYQVQALANGNYLVLSEWWGNGAVTNAGAVTWCSGTNGLTGTVSAVNSLVGSTANDWVGFYVIELANGNYVACSASWANGAFAKAGAATWGSGTGGVTGVVSAVNSLVGSAANDRVCIGQVTALSNGNYVVCSEFWNGAFTEAGAATWGSGTGGVTGVVSAANSLVGGKNYDHIGHGGATALANGNYVVCSRDWDNGVQANVGAVTWGSGTGGLTGAVSPANSLVGIIGNDYVGLDGVKALSNGNYVVCSSWYRNVAVAHAGAATWGSGTGGSTGVVSAANSLVGSTYDDLIGDWVTEVAGGNYVVCSTNWNNGTATNAGAVTFCNGTGGLTGVVSVANSLLGNLTNGSGSMVFDFDPVNSRLVVGYPAGNLVMLDRGAIKHSQAITNFTPTNGSVFVLTNTVGLSAAGGGSTNPVVFALLSGPSVLDGTNLAFTNSGSVRVTANQAGDTNWVAAPTVTNTYTVTKIMAQVTLTNLVQVYDGTPRVVGATTVPGGLPVTITYDGSGSAPTAPGNYAVTGEVNSALYQGSTNGTLTVNKMDQSITFPAIPDQMTTSTVTLAATASSGLAVSFSVASGPGTISGDNILAFTGAGVVQVTASQAGNELWNAAADVTRDITVHDVPSLVAPRNLAASDGTYADKVAVTWSAVSGAGGYQVWRAGANNSAAAVNLGNATPPRYDDNSSALRSATMFYYWVKACNSVATSEFSAVANGFCRMSTDTGLVSGQPMVGDYDGDNKADPAVYNLTDGRLFAWLSSAAYLLVTPVATFQAAAGDLPVAGDFDGDRLADPGVFQRLTGSWYIWLSSAGYTKVGPLSFGVDLNDMPIPADYDGDGKADPAVCNAGLEWYVWLSSAGYYRVGPLTIFRVDAADTPVPAQFDADLLADPAVYQAQGGNWYVWLSSAGYSRIGPIALGTTGEHLAVPADYDGDGLADPAAYVPTNGVWRIWESGNGYTLKELPLR